MRFGEEKNSQRGRGKVEPDWGDDLMVWETETIYKDKDMESDYQANKQNKDQDISKSWYLE